MITDPQEYGKLYEQAVAFAQQHFQFTASNPKTPQTSDNHPLVLFTSAKKRVNVDEVFHSIVGQVVSHKLMSKQKPVKPVKKSVFASISDSSQADEDIAKIK